MRGLRGIAIILAGVVALAGCATATGGSDPVSAGAASGSSAGSTAGSMYSDLAPAEPTTDLAIVAVAELPPEGIETLELIVAGGPFPYDQDGSTFQNREGILPKEPSGFYSEYTVETPGSQDRGARRIVAGDDGSRFYTADHYSTFREVVSG